jgi:hypothetical protein
MQKLLVYVCLNIPGNCCSIKKQAHNHRKQINPALLHRHVCMADDALPLNSTCIAGIPLFSTIVGSVNVPGQALRTSRDNAFQSDHHSQGTCADLLQSGEGGGLLVQLHHHQPGCVQLLPGTGPMRYTGCCECAKQRLSKASSSISFRAGSAWT